MHVCLIICLAVFTCISASTNNSNINTDLNRGSELDDLDLSGKIRFYLYTRSQNETPTQMEINNIQLGFPFNAELKTKILIHGYRNDLNSSMIQSIRQAYLGQGEDNVIAVDWGDLAFATRSGRDIGVTLRGVNYPLAKRNTYHVGTYIGRFVDYLVTRGGVDLEKVHLIGHSLGAHTAGVAGAAVTQGRVARITGLDPSGIYFATEPPSTRLDKSDAEFVDVLHTNYRDVLGGSTSLGFKEPCGHVDYYLNGGAHQPDCCNESRCDEVCSHRKAYQYFEMMIKDKTTFPAYKCASLDHVFFNTWECVGYPKCSKYPSGYFMGDVLESHGIYYVYINGTQQCKS